MKEYFYEEKDKVYIIDDKKGLIVDNNKDNNIDLFKIENNIESIEESINDEINIKNENDKLRKSIKTNSILLGVLGSIILIFSVYMASLTTSIVNLIIIFLAGGCISLLPFVERIEYNDLKKKILSSEKYISELENELKEEKSILNILNLDSKPKTTNNDTVIMNEIPSTEFLKKLKRKRELIINFFENKKEFIEYYKKGNLKELYSVYEYDNFDIDFINCLIREIYVEDNIKKTKQKTK